MVSSNKGKVCVTGASGFIASWLIKRLLESGYHVVGTVRNPGIYEYIITFVSILFITLILVYQFLHNELFFVFVTYKEITKKQHTFGSYQVPKRGCKLCERICWKKGALTKPWWTVMASSTLHPLFWLNLILVARHAAFALNSSLFHQSSPSCYICIWIILLVFSFRVLSQVATLLWLYKLKSFCSNSSFLLWKCIYREVKLLSCDIHVAGGNSRSSSKWYSECAKIVQEEPISEKGCSYIVIICSED